MSAVPGTASATAPLGVGGWRARWAGLAPRERALVGGAVVLVVLALLWGVAIAPAWRTLRSAPAERARLETQWQTMQRQAAEVRALREAPPLAPGLAVQALQAATERLGPAARLTLQGDRAVLTVTALPGPALMQWLAESRRGARAQPVELRLSRDGDGYTGTVIVQQGTAP